MAKVTMPIPLTKELQGELDDQLKALRFSVQNLSLMECQFLAGENAELPKETLDQWFESLSQQRALVRELQNRLQRLENTTKIQITE